MEAILDFIANNFWLLIILFVFLSGFSKSKKKKDQREDREQQENIPGGTSENWDPIEAEEKPVSKPRRNVFDSLPIPTELKELIEEFQETEEAPWNRKKKEAPPVSEPVRPQHFDAPYSGEGKVQPHQEVRPTYVNADPYGGEGKVFPQAPTLPRNAAAAYSGEGKVRGKSTVKPQIQALPEENAYAPDVMKGLAKKASARKLAEAVVMAEVLAKPKALRKNKA
ncbi:MAG: hypothetical protein Q4C00_03980 [Bacillota bacterium]|nr:hypothetical protein [Bacillota bacterium]